MTSCVFRTETHRCLFSLPRLVCGLAMLTLTVSQAMATETPLPVADLEPGTIEGSTFVVNAAMGDDELLFWADDGERGAELWISDGTSDGTRLWAEVCPGDCPDATPFGNGSDGVAYDGRNAFFLFDDGIHGKELWIADGSVSGTRLVADLCSGACDSEIRELALVGDKLYFSLETPELGTEPWVSDGTSVGTQNLGDIHAGPASSFPLQFTPFGDGVAFLAITDEHGGEWWSTRGTPGDPVRLTDLCPGDCSVTPRQVQAIEGGILFTSLADNPTESLYRLSPGESPVALANLCQSSHCFNFGQTFHVIGSDVFFDREDRLWSTDGTVEGTGVVAEMPEQILFAKSMTRLDDGTLLLLAKQKPYDGSLWKVEGDGLVGPLVEVDADAYMASLGDRAIVIDPTSDSIDLWRTDGTAEGTVAYDRQPSERSFSSFVQRPAVLGNQVLFGARFHEDFRLAELLATRGQTGDLRSLLGVEMRPAGSRPRELASAGSRVVFRTDKDDRVLEDLWAVDDFGRTTRLLEAVEPEGLETVELAVGPRVFFEAFDEFGDQTPRLTDGTLEGTLDLSDPGDLSLSWSREPKAFRGDLFFLADQGLGQKIWRHDGSAGPAELVVDLQPDWDNIHVGCPICSPPIFPGPIFPREIQVLGSGATSRLVFVGGQVETGAELWQSDGTAEGTTLVADLSPGSVGSEPEDLMPAGNRLVFTADTGNGRELRLWDGQDGIANLGAVGEIVASTPWGDRVVWLERNGDLFVLRVSDGTPAGTYQLGALPAETVPDDTLVVSADRLFFVASDVFGAELWISDLEQGGQEPRRLVDIRPGTAGSFPDDLVNFGDQLYFSAADDEHGRELWRLHTRSSILNPIRLDDVAPGPASSSPSEPVLMTPERPELQPYEFVFFAADDGVSGRELWVTDLPVSAGNCQADATTLCLESGRFRVSVLWEDAVNGTQGVGQAVPFSNDSGQFWFFDENNLELVVKVIDGREVNDTFWFYYGALSDVSYEILVEDLVSGISKTYVNPQGNFCGRGDIDAFPAVVAGPAEPVSPAADLLGFLSQEFSVMIETPAASSEAADKSDVCTLDPALLCLNRFQITVQWRDHQGNTGEGQRAFTNGQTGFMWFFEPGNIELGIKIIDGTEFNDAFWVFYGALSDVEYTIRVHDTSTGVVKVYENEAGNLCGRGDTGAFPNSP